MKRKKELKIGISKTEGQGMSMMAIHTAKMLDPVFEVKDVEMKQTLGERFKKEVRTPEFWMSQATHVAIIAGVILFIVLISSVALLLYESGFDETADWLMKTLISVVAIVYVFSVIGIVLYVRQKKKKRGVKER